MKTSFTGWAIFSPFGKSLVIQTFDNTRKFAIMKSGCETSKQWKELYRLGFRAKKVLVKEIK